jgi:hypothetical protein
LKNSKDKEGKDCVVRACPTIHEASAFNVNLKANWDGTEQISRLSGLVPIHVIFGEKADFMSVAYLEFMSLPQLSLIVLDHRPKAIHDCAVDEAKGRKVSSITRIPGGHTVR